MKNKICKEIGIKYKFTKIHLEFHRHYDRKITLVQINTIKIKVKFTSLTITIIIIIEKKRKNKICKEISIKY